MLYGSQQAPLGSKYIITDGIVIEEWSGIPGFPSFTTFTVLNFG